MTDTNVIYLNDKQKLFMRTKKKNVCYGGARGGGKSWVVRCKARLMAMRYPGIKIMIIRQSYPELRENHIIPLCADLHCYADKEHRLATYNDSEKCIKLWNGSRIIFRYCENEKDTLRFQGLEVDVMFIDEATHFTESQKDKLSACVRGANGFPHRIYYTCNPGGVGHNWVKRLFIDRNFKAGENPDDYEFIQALVYDNKILMERDPEYVNRLESLTPSLRAAWLDGRWDVFEGQFFEEFRNIPEHYKDRKYTHVIEPFDIPDSWQITRSYDYGYSKPFSCAWWATDHDGIVYRILELYGCSAGSDGTPDPNVGVKWDPKKQFSEIHKIENTHPWLKGKRIFGVADPSIWDGSRGESIQETASQCGVYFSKGDNARIAGWMQMHYRMRFDDDGYPMMYIFKNCKAFIRTVPLLIFSETHPEDLDTNMEDHAADDARYFCMTRPISPRIKQEKKEIADDPLDLLKDGFMGGKRLKKEKTKIFYEED